MAVTDLPEDILAIIFEYLDPKSFLALCRSTKAFYSNYQLHPTFWRTQTATTFRTPISPLLKADGARWYSLYKRLRTQTRLYTWGQGIKGNLGQGVRHDPGFSSRGPRAPRGRGHRPLIPTRARPQREVFARLHSQWPTEAHVPDDIGVVADLQCGGWSTTILSSAGKLYTTGCINAANYVYAGSSVDRFEQLHYLTQKHSAISQFSAGRTHILALNDHGDIVSWDRINGKGLKVHSRHGGKFVGRPARVVAGWGESSVYVPDSGILYWRPLETDVENEELDAREVKERTIPGTARTRNRDGTIIEVVAHIVLEGILVWITSESKIFACEIGHQNQEDTEPVRPAVQLPGYFDGSDALKDIQGSFRHFVVFTESGRVLRGDVDYVYRCAQASRAAIEDRFDDAIDMSEPSTWPQLAEITASRPTDVPALQGTGVISVRFGDWHYHALHSDGKITSHGHEPESCGALGLGQADTGGRLRGMVKPPGGSRQDTKLRPVANLTGRQIWFEPEKRDWLEHLQHTAENEFTKNRQENFWNDILNDNAKQMMFSEWIEQEGRHWEDGPHAAATTSPVDLKQLTLQDDNLHVNSYFALAIGAAGWHSGALVLVDDDKVSAVREKWTGNSMQSRQQGDSPVEDQVPRMPGHFEDSANGEETKPLRYWETDSFPRIGFPDGTESPAPEGDKQTLRNALRPWRDGMPSLQELGLLST